MESAQSLEVNPAASHSSGGHLFLSRSWDFWLLGGIAIVLWIPIYFLQETLDPVKSLGGSLPMAAFLLAYWVNYPHFMASYKLAYGQGREFIRQNGFQLILVPVAMVLFVALAFANWTETAANSVWPGLFNGLLSLLGASLRLGQEPSMGPELLGLLLQFMYFTVGWHYAKQTFGCMMVYARFDRYPLTVWQRNLIRYSLLSTWWVTWLYSNCSSGFYYFYELKVYRLGLPPWMFDAAMILFLLLLTATLVGVFGYNFLRQQRRPSANMLVPMVALLIWHIPLFGNPQYFYVIALFHSLQYLPFVAKVERARFRQRQRSKPWLRLGLLYLALALVGYLAFDGVPSGLDQFQASQAQLGMSFFLICFIAFINIHHYFIDNVLWRFKNPEVRRLLFEDH